MNKKKKSYVEVFSHKLLEKKEETATRKNKTVALSKVLELLLGATGELSKVLSFIPTHCSGYGRPSAFSHMPIIFHFMQDEDKKPK